MILTIIRARGVPVQKEREDELESFCRAMNIISRRDMDGTVMVVFRSILTKGRAQPVGSSELADFTHLNRVTIIHHLQRLQAMGLVEHTERKYLLRVSALSEAVERMREEMLESFKEAEEMAGRLDREFMLDAPLMGRAETGPRRLVKEARTVGASAPAAQAALVTARKKGEEPPALISASRDRRPRPPSPKKREL